MVLLMAVAVGLLAQVLPKQRKLFLSFCGGGLLLAFSGHFWITPETMAKGWDSMLSHIWYLDYRDEAVRYLKTQNIASGTVGSDFPNLATHQQITLENDSYYFIQKNVSEQTYILQSNAMNGFSETELTQLRDTMQWTLEKSWGSWPVYVRLYRRK
jgi:hypothetical protein